MADIEVNASPSFGANESETRRGGPPSPSPSTAPESPLPDAPMQANHVQPLPTTSSAYRAIANLNRGFELDRRNLVALQEFGFFPEEELIAWGNVLGRLQADASLHLLDILHDRLMNNTLYYDRLCWVREKQLEDPDDVLISAEHRKRELATEQQRQEQKSEEDT